MYASTSARDFACVCVWVGVRACVGARTETCECERVCGGGGGGVGGGVRACDVHQRVRGCLCFSVCQFHFVLYD